MSLRFPKALAACALTAALLATAWKAPEVPAAPARTGAGRAKAAAAQLGAAQQYYLALAEAGVRQATSRWADRRRGWYDAYLGGRARYPLATIWSIVPLFESLDAIAIASPTAANRAAVERFAKGAERYLNRGLRPLAGFSPYPGDREPSTETWFDDNGWWGLGFVNAYRATGRHRYLTDAMQALRYIAAVGWDPAAGGIWWNTTHPYKAGEALAAATALAAELYQQTHSAFALAQAQRFLIWANGPGFSSADGLYARSDVDPTPIDYIEGPLIYANELLCRLGAEPGGCARAEQLKATALRRFGRVLDFSPQYDAIYLQWMLALYSLDGDPALYSLAADNATAAREHALDGRGLYLRSWAGGPLPAAYALPNQLQTQAATTSVFAWLAVYPPPLG